MVAGTTSGSYLETKNPKVREMMHYMVGIDPDTNEIIVGDRRDNIIFLRGSADSAEMITRLVSAANFYNHPADDKCEMTRLELIAEVERLKRLVSELERSDRQDLHPLWEP